MMPPPPHSSDTDNVPDPSGSVSGVVADDGAEFVNCYAADYSEDLDA